MHRNSTLVRSLTCSLGFSLSCASGIGLIASSAYAQADVDAVQARLMDAVAADELTDEQAAAMMMRLEEMNIIASPREVTSLDEQVAIARMQAWFNDERSELREAVRQEVIPAREARGQWQSFVEGQATIALNEAVANGELSQATAVSMRDALLDPNQQATRQMGNLQQRLAQQGVSEDAFNVLVSTVQGAGVPERAMPRVVMGVIRLGRAYATGQDATELTAQIDGLLRGRLGLSDEQIAELDALARQVAERSAVR